MDFILSKIISRPARALEVALEVEKTLDSISSDHEYLSFNICDVGDMLTDEQMVIFKLGLELFPSFVILYKLNSIDFDRVFASGGNSLDRSIAQMHVVDLVFENGNSTFFIVPRMSTIVKCDLPSFEAICTRKRSKSMHSTDMVKHVWLIEVIVVVCSNSTKQKKAIFYYKDA